MTDAPAHEVVVLDIRTRKLWDGVVAPPLKPPEPPFEFIGPVKPLPDKMSVELLAQIMEDTIDGQIHSLGFIGVDLKGMPIAALSLPAHFNPAFQGARMLALEVLKDMIMIELQGGTQQGFVPGDEDDDDYEEMDDE